MNSTIIIIGLVCLLIGFVLGAWLVRDEKRADLADAQRELASLRAENTRLREIKETAKAIAEDIWRELLVADKAGVRR